MLSGRWLDSGRVLQIRVEDVSGVSCNKDDYEIGNLKVTLVEGGGLKDAGNLSPPHPSVQWSVSGSWGVPSPPQILSVTAVNSGGQAGFGDGDSVMIEFNQDVCPSECGDDGGGVERVVVSTSVG